MLSFLVASLNDEVKIVFIDGALENGTVRSIRGRIVKETDSSITIERSNGTLTIGKNFIIKIENWHNGRQQFDY
jgi:hypothetical protein